MILITVKLIALVVLVAAVLAPALILILLFTAQVLIRIIIKVFKKNSPAPPFLGPLLDSDFRRAFQKPEVIIRRSGITEGMKVLEVGCGSGAFTTFVARKIGPKGAGYALDIQKEMLKQVERKLAKEENEDIKNVVLVESDVYEIPFADNYFDLIFLVSVLQQIPDKQKALLEMKRVLRRDGILAITEVLMDPYYSFRSTTIRLGQTAGFRFDAAEGNVLHYTVRFRK